MRTRTIVLALAFVVGCHKNEAPAEAITIGVLAELQGVTEPCGCTTRPLGGIDRIAQRLETLAQGAPFGLVIAGNTFVTYPNPRPQEAAQEGAKARVLAEILAKLKPLASGLGTWDENAVAKQALGGLPEAARGVVGWPPHFDTQLRTLGGLKLGFISTSTDITPNEAAAVNTQAADLRGQGANLVVLLGSGGMPAARSLAPFLESIDAVVTGGGEPPLAPEEVNGAWLFDAGAKGQQLGVLELHPKAAGPWQLFDGGQAKRAALDSRRARMLSEAQSLPEGPARDARQSRAAALAEEANAISSAAPTVAYFKWRTEDIDTQHPPAAWATQMMAAYNRSLCETSRAATANRVCPPAENGLTYVGNATCKACHAGAFALYDKSQHATAWSTLTRVGKECDLGCIGCHTLGYEKPGGFCRLADAEKFANVNCENCHGPASAHVAHPQDAKAWGAGFIARPGEALCKTCHTHEHSDAFEFETYVGKITGEGHRRRP